MARKRSLERENYWRDVIARQEASGHSIAAFCRNESISPPSFYSWRRRIRSEDAVERRRGPAAESSPLRLKQIEIPAPPMPLVLTFRQWNVALPPGTVDHDALAAVVQALEEHAC